MQSVSSHFTPDMTDNSDINNQRKLWRDRWLDSINELTSLRLQQESWLDNSHSNPHWSFVEFMCCYFDDLSIDKNYEDLIASGYVSQQEFEIINQWHEDLNNYDSPNNDDYDNQAILNDSKWLDIVKLGELTKNILAEVLNSDERQILMQEINYLNFI